MQPSDSDKLLAELESQLAEREAERDRWRDDYGDLAIRMAEREAELERLQERYNDLLYQVEQKHPDETRHETAKRLICKAQQSSGETKAGLAQERRKSE